MKVFLIAALMLAGASAYAQEGQIPRGFVVTVFSDCGGQSCSADAAEAKIAEIDTVVIATVTQLNCNSPAAKAGLRDNDIITAINGKVLRGIPSDEAWDLVDDMDRGEPMMLTIMRKVDGKDAEFTIRFTAAWYTPGECEDA